VPATKKRFTKEEVAKHNTEEVLLARVFDVRMILAAYPLSSDDARRKKALALFIDHGPKLSISISYFLPLLS
jgi:hypothetical protein